MQLPHFHFKQDSASWLPGLAAFLREQSSAEAIRFNPTKRTIEVATLGVVDLAALEAELARTLRAIEAKIAAPDAAADPLPKAFSVRQEGPVFILEKPSCTTAPSFWQWRTLPWPELKAGGCCSHEHDWEVLAGLAAACGLLGFLGYVTEEQGFGAAWVPPVFYVLAFLTGGWDALHDIAKKIPKGQFDIHFLMIMVAIGASLIGAWGEGVLLLFLFSASGAMEAFALYRTRKGIDALFKKVPEAAWKIEPSGEEIRIPIAQIVPGDILRVRPGELFAVDGAILDGESAADEANLTGESVPVDKRIGDRVYSGTLNLWGSVQVRVLKPASESSLQKVIRLIQDAQHLKAPSQRFTERFGTRYTLGILMLTAVMFFVWYLGFGISPFTNTPEVYSAFYRAMTLLVVASPCALVLSIPSAILAGIAWGAMKGILFRGGAAIERLSEVTCVALDKTGTLTTGDLVVESVESFPPGREKEMLQMALSMEAHASHPLARAIVRHGRQHGLEPTVVDSFKSLTGMGLQGVIGGKSVILGRRELLQEGPLLHWARALPEPGPEYSEVWIIAEDALGRLLLKDQIRLESAPVLAELAKLGIETLMLTGDRAETANAVGQRIGIKTVKAGLKPHEKVAALQAFKAKGFVVAMVGDGFNDAPSLAAADVAVAMGARGSDAALEQSEVVLMNDRIDLFLAAYRLSRHTRGVIRQNLAISIVTIFCMIVSSLMGIIPLAIGVMAHEGSTFLVCLNSLRVLLYKPQLLKVEHKDNTA